MKKSRAYAASSAIIKPIEKAKTFTAKTKEKL